MKEQKDYVFLCKLIKLCWVKQKKYMLLMCITSIPTVLLPFVILIALQCILNAAQKNMMSNVIVYTLIYFASLLMLRIFEALSEYIQGIFQIRIDYDINCIIIDQATKLDMTDYENSETYDRLQRALRETQTAYQYINYMFSIVNNSITIIGSLFIVILWKWYILGLLVCAPFISLYFTVLIGKYEFLVIQQRSAGMRKIAYLRNLISDASSFKENKILSGDLYFYCRFKELFQQFVKKDKEILSYRSINAIIFASLETIIGVLAISSIIYELTFKTILVGTANTYIQCIWNIIKSTDRFITNIANIYTKSQYLRNLFEFIESNDSRDNDVSINGDIVIDSIESIEFINVSFKYREDLPYVLKNINIKITKDDKIVIIGENGSGKSTFIKLISNLYKNYEGEILVNGISLKKIREDSIYSKMGIVFQDFMKYEFTLRENMLLGNMEIPIDTLNKNVDYLNQNGLLTFYNKLQNGLDTQLGTRFDRGVQLSGGQWQQVAFSRAIMRKAELLIFDEPSSSLDVISEGKMYDILNEETDGRISLLVTHRLYIAERFAQRALVFKDGEIIEDASIDELMTYDSSYKYMLNKTIVRDENFKVV